MATHHFPDYSINDIAKRADKLSSMLNEDAWTTHDVQFLLDVIKEKDAEISNLNHLLSQSQGS